MITIPITGFKVRLDKALKYISRKEKISSSISSDVKEDTEIFAILSDIFIQEFIEEISLYLFKGELTYIDAVAEVKLNLNQSDDYLLPSDTYTDNCITDLSLGNARKIVETVEEYLEKLDKGYYLALRIFSKLEDLYVENSYEIDEDESLVKIQYYSFDYIVSRINSIYPDSKITMLSREFFENKFHEPVADLVEEVSLQSEIFTRLQPINCFTQQQVGYDITPEDFDMVEAIITQSCNYDVKKEFINNILSVLSSDTARQYAKMQLDNLALSSPPFNLDNLSNVDMPKTSSESNSSFSFLPLHSEKISLTDDIVATEEIISLFEGAEAGFEAKDYQLGLKKYIAAHNLYVECYNKQRQPSNYDDDSFPWQIVFDYPYKTLLDIYVGGDTIKDPNIHEFLIFLPFFLNSEKISMALICSLFEANPEFHKNYAKTCNTILGPANEVECTLENFHLILAVFEIEYMRGNLNFSYKIFSQLKLNFSSFVEANYSHEEILKFELKYAEQVVEKNFDLGLEIYTSILDSRKNSDVRELFNINKIILDKYISTVTCFKTSFSDIENLSLKENYNKYLTNLDGTRKIPIKEAYDYYVSIVKNFFDLLHKSPDLLASGAILGEMYYKEILSSYKKLKIIETEISIFKKARLMEDSLETFKNDVAENPLHHEIEQAQSSPNEHLSKILSSCLLDDYNGTNIIGNNEEII